MAVHRYSRCMQVFFFMPVSFAALLRGPNAAGVAPVRAARQQHKYNKHTVESNIDLGERVATFISSEYGAELAAQMLEKVLQRANGSQPSPVDDSVLMLDVPNGAAWVPISDIVSDQSKYADFLPYGFWPRFMKEELKEQCTQRRKKQLIRALNFYLQAKDKGASTIAGLRGMRDRHSCRNKGGGR